MAADEQPTQIRIGPARYPMGGWGVRREWGWGEGGKRERG